MHIHAPLKFLGNPKTCWNCKVKKVTKDRSIAYAVCKPCYKLLCAERTQADMARRQDEMVANEQRWEKKWKEQLGRHVERVTLFGDKIPPNILYPTNRLELEVQSYIFGVLKEKGYDVRLEVYADDNQCRMDVVLFRQDKIAALAVETKRHESLEDQEQLQRYARLGVKVISVSGMSEAVYFCQWFSKNSRRFLAIPKNK